MSSFLFCWFLNKWLPAKLHKHTYHTKNLPQHTCSQNSLLFNKKKIKIKIKTVAKSREVFRFRQTLQCQTQLKTERVPHAHGFPPTATAAVPQLQYFWWDIASSSQQELTESKVNVIRERKACKYCLAKQVSRLVSSGLQKEKFPDVKKAAALSDTNPVNCRQANAA